MSYIKVQVEPWAVPTSIHLQSTPGVTMPSAPLDVNSPLITPDLLSEMCEEFRANVFKQYGLTDPRHTYRAEIDGLFGHPAVRQSRADVTNHTQRSSWQ